MEQARVTVTIVGWWDALWQDWGGLDPSIQAAWIGVVGALIGALVGGLLTATATAWATRGHWRRQEHRENLLILDKAVAAYLIGLVRDIAELPEDAQDMHLTWQQKLELPMLGVRAKAARSKHLAKLLYDATQIANDVDEKAFAFDEVLALYTALHTWMGAPKDFERNGRSFDFFVEKGKRERKFPTWEARDQRAPEDAKAGET